MLDLEGSYVILTSRTELNSPRCTTVTVCVPTGSQACSSRLIDLWTYLPLWTGGPRVTSLALRTRCVCLSVRVFVCVRLFTVGSHKKLTYSTNITASEPHVNLNSTTCEPRECRTRNSLTFFAPYCMCALTPSSPHIRGIKNQCSI